jgi:hypothetical protein
MNRLTFYVILLHGLFLGVTTASAKSPPANRLNTELPTQQKVDRVAVSTVKAGVTEQSDSRQLTLEPLKKVGSDSLAKISKQVWVINQNQQPQHQGFKWIVQDPKQAGRNHFCKREKLQKNQVKSLIQPVNQLKRMI